MKLLYDFFPLLVFFGVFKLYGIYAATAAAIAASVIQVALFWNKNRRLEPVHLITLAAILVFGGLTLVLHDDVFIKWKPTIVNWVFAILMLGTQFIAGKPAIRLVLGKQLQLPDRVWHRLNLSWALFFTIAGALNLYVAFWYGADLDPATRQEIWVNFKVFGLFGLTLLFAVAQALFLARYMEPETTGKEQ